MNRLLKISVWASVAAYMFFVIFNNLFDYNSNYQYISNVASMNDVFEGNVHTWRSLQSSALHHAMFAMIILWKTTIFGLLAAGTYQMYRHLNDDKDAFENAKKYAQWGLGVGVLLWFLVFVAVGGEWFLMWQSKDWNGQEVGFSLTICFLLFANYLHQKDT
ncbi:MAG: DUF2165 domain-containing protein [Spirosomaceae bacterium]|nr:DUF2165 domain-containing protein [Spirosomataceae bacterium]